jgi:hypothetical protein
MLTQKDQQPAFSLRIRPIPITCVFRLLPDQSSTMKSFNIIAALGLLLASSVAAQSQCSSVADKIPTCGKPCLISAGSAIGCGSDDFACRCTSSEALASKAQNCVINGCGIATAIQVRQSASAVCGCVATATPPSAPTSPTSTAAPAQGGQC